MFEGKGTSIGFCTVWNEPELLFKRSETIREHSAIIGTLYSRQGVNIILRNLARNPQIRTLFVWGNGTLSNTQFGLAGKGVLDTLWREGVDAEGFVRTTKFKLEKEIDPAVVEKIRKEVQLLDISSASFDDAEIEVEKVAAVAVTPYMEPVIFPDAVPEKVDMFPSEEVGFAIHGRGILDAWVRVVDRIMRYGTIKGTQLGLQQRELIGVTWVASIEDPVHPNLAIANEWPKELRETTGATETAIKEYHSVFLSAEKPENIFYTYGNRLMQYPTGTGSVIDQIKEIMIPQLKNSPNTRRAVATTMVPPIDKDSKDDSPCITQVQAIQVNGKLHFLVTARSHDIFKAAIPNAFGLRTLQKTIADETGFELGKLQITSQSAHIYEQDWENAAKMMRCLFWERPPSLTFDATNADPRGLFTISISSGAIEASFKSPLGDDLAKLEGKSAKEVANKIAQLELLLRTDHIFDIGMELQKAEIALTKKIPYQQDRPLIFYK